ncbi:MAG: SMC-Scp complex subunit ScpB [Acidimicrobiales bacterium]|jgi:segregation and condensation protein B|nr:SMC-Scp complex subunit ScpB [Acidimicrobiales bacterium]
MATEAAKAIEAILMVAQEPVDPHLLAQLLEVAPARVTELCDELRAAYEADDRGFVLVKVAGGYRFQSHADLAPYVERFVLEGQSARLSAAALETLAIVAYKQPISRAQVAAIRGVNVDGVMRTLQQRGYIDEVGRDPGPGQATLFGTTREFLERLGLDSLRDLPPIADLLPDASVLEALEKGLRPDPPQPVEPPPAVGEHDEPADHPADGPETEPEGAGDSESESAEPSGPPPLTASEPADQEPELPSWFEDPEPPTPAPTTASSDDGRDEDLEDQPDTPEAPDAPAEQTPDGP